jgi:hypothetical protein
MSGRDPGRRIAWQWIFWHSLRAAPQELDALAPTRYLVAASGGTGAVATNPWFGFLNPNQIKRSLPVHV